jgi:nucleoside-diphosphate-sugar epimerase
VTGATSLVGRFLLPRLREVGLEVHAVSRRPHLEGASIRVVWHALDIEAGSHEWDVGRVSHLIHLAPLWLLPNLVPRLASRGLLRLIGFGSTSRLSKTDSSDPRERQIAGRLARAEEELESACAAHGVQWTLMRPTLIYGGGLDHNVTTIAGVIRRLGIFPVVAEARGLRQPVHADDLAQACLAALANPATFNRAYDLHGGTTLRYREMVEAIFRGLGRRPRILSLPLPLCRTLLRGLSLLPGYRHVTPAMADRMNQDLCFDAGDAMRDFDYHPRPFSYPD